jgi:uncharacterized protein (DUF1499 family)
VRRIVLIALALVAVLAVSSPLWLVPLLDVLGVQRERLAGDLHQLAPAPAKQNEYFVAPKDFAPMPPHREAPVYARPAATVAAALEKIITAAPRVEWTGKSGDGLRLEAIQRTAGFKFPDRITIEVMPLLGDRATLAVFSRSRYGRRDFGVNQARVDAWLAALDAEMKR